MLRQRVLARRGQLGDAWDGFSSDFSWEGKSEDAHRYAEKELFKWQSWLPEQWIEALLPEVAPTCSLKGGALGVERIQALAPTRGLAKQVENEIFLTAPSLNTVCVYGGTPIGAQEGKLRRGVDIVVGTPGRVMDLMERGSLFLGDIEFVVLDEADQMLNVGFEEDVETILQDCPETRQTFLFSATMPSWVKQITKKFLAPQHTVVAHVMGGRC